MATAPQQPAGNDPRLKLDKAEREAAAGASFPQVGAPASRFDFGFLAIVAAALGLGAVTWITLTAHPSVPAPQIATAPKPAVQAKVSPQAAPASAPAAVSDEAPHPSRAAAMSSAIANSSTPAMVIDNSTAPAEVPGKTGPGPNGNTALLDSNEQFAARFGSASGEKPSRIDDPAHTIPQGAIIPAVLETALNSDLPGFARAIVSRDVKGFDGSKVLVPRGSRLIGQYKSGLSSGATRAFIIWERLIRPDGVSVQLASPAMDDIGQTGLTGDVDTHFLKRFGAAVMLSVVSGLSTYSSGTAVIIGSTGAQSAASDALGGDAKIPPTIKIAQGSVIQVFVARDLDFGS